jgi:hypothetical protein
MAAMLPTMAFIAMIVVAIAPRSTPFMLLLLGASIVAAAAATNRTIGFRPLANLVWALVAMGAYLVLNSFWSVSPIFGLGRVVLFALIVAMGLAVVRAIPMLSRGTLDQLCKALILAIGIAAVFLAFETVFGQPIRRFVVSIVPVLRPPPKHMQVVNDWVTGINLYTLNRNLALLNVFLWPALLLLKARRWRRESWLAGAALIAVTGIAAFNSEHESSMIALVTGCLIFVGMTFAPALSRALVIAAWFGATMLIVPAANIAHDAGLHHADWIPQTARNRIVLWNVTADRLHRAPILGIGIGSTKPLDEKAAASAPVEEGDTYAQRTGRHAHNIFMQTWYELGAIGAILLLVIGAIALRAMVRLPSADQPFAFASFASTMVLAGFTWGIWQPWFMCAFGLWAVLLLVSLDATRRASDTRSSASSLTSDPSTHGGHPAPRGMS